MMHRRLRFVVDNIIKRGNRSLGHLLHRHLKRRQFRIGAGTISLVSKGKYLHVGRDLDIQGSHGIQPAGSHDVMQIKNRGGMSFAVIKNIQGDLISSLLGCLAKAEILFTAQKR